MSGAMIGRDRSAMPPSPRVAMVRFGPHDLSETWREAEALRDAGAEVDLICVGTKGEQRRETIDGIRVLRVRVNKRRGGAAAYLTQYAHWFAACFVILARESIRRPYHSVQVANLPDHQVFAALVPRLRGARIIVTFKEPAAELIGLLLGPRAVPAIKLSTRAALRFVDQGICVTEAHHQNYIAQGAAADRLVVVPTATPKAWLGDGVPPEFDPAAVVAMTHGTMEERWGYEPILRAVALAAPKLENLHLVLPGRGTFSDRVVELAAELGLSDRVHLPGFVSTEELHGWLHRADIGLSCQLESAYSHLVHTGKLTDFMLAGVPVVSSRLTATVETYEGCCLFVDPASPEEMAAAIVRLAKDQELAAELTSEAMTRLETEGWEAAIPTYIAAVLG